jgi:hypothetical protein
MAFIYDLTDTWNAGGTTFNAIKMNVTDTASAAASRLLTLQVGGAERFSVDKAGIGTFASVVRAAAGSTGAPAFSFTSDTNTGMWSPSADAIAFSTAGSERLRVDASGNVGIGTTNPGSWRLRIENADAQPLLLVNTAGNGTRIRMADQSWQGEIEQNAGNLLFKTGGDTERMRITSAGNVGIGTSAPLARLHASAPLSSGNIVNVGFFAQNSGSNPTIGQGTRITLSANNNPDRAAAIEGVHESLSNAHYLAFLTSANATAPAERMRITSTGNVGIGVTPSAWRNLNTALQIGYTGVVYGRTLVEELNLQTNGFINISGQNIYTQNGFASLYKMDAGQHRWFTAPSGTAGNVLTFAEVMRITSAGNVGINESAPDYKLDVNGTFGFTPGASVTPVDNGDVVFELTNNTTLTIKAKGSDGVVRSGTIVLV